MKFKLGILISTLAIALFSACSDDHSTIVQPDDQGPEASDMTKQVTIQVDTKFQTIEGFAASDCWTGNYVGKYWSQTQKEGIARLLFSSSVHGTQPEGIGLSMWRFNLGGGTAEQGSESGIEDKSRRAECFLNANGSLDWTRQAGQQYFLEKARDYGCQQFVMFSNTPPVHYTRNGKGYSNSGAYSNLRTDSYTLFANYMAHVADYFKREKNIEFTFISPVNEPQYNWESGQEGSGWQNSEIKTLVTELDKALEEKQLTNTKILVAEAGDWEYTYRVKDGAGRSNVINDFFDSSSANYMGDLKHLYPAIAGHSYWTDGSWNTLTSVRSQVAAAAAARNIKVFQTEWSMLGDGYADGYPGHNNASHLDIALYMSRVIHTDLTVANASSWSYWTSMDVDRWGHKNRFFLIQLNPADGAYGDIAGSGSHQATKNLWVLGNYSLFVRPGFQRVGLEIANPSTTFFGSAYLSPDNKQLVVVYTNISTRSIGLDVAMPGLNSEIESVKRYTTSLGQNLVEQELPHDKCTIQPQSVMTLVYQLK